GGTDLGQAEGVVTEDGARRAVSPGVGAEEVAVDLRDPATSRPRGDDEAIFVDDALINPVEQAFQGYARGLMAQLRDVYNKQAPLDSERGQAFRTSIPLEGPESTPSLLEADRALFYKGEIEDEGRYELAGFRMGIKGSREYQEAKARLGKDIDIYFLPTQDGADLFHFGEDDFAAAHLDEQEGRLYVALPIFERPLAMDVVLGELSGQYRDGLEDAIKRIGGEDQRNFAAQRFFSSQRHQEERNNLIQPILEGVVGELREQYGIELPLESVEIETREGPKKIWRHNFEKIFEDQSDGYIFELESGITISRMSSGKLIFIGPQFQGLNHAGRGKYQLAIYAEDDQMWWHELDELDVLIERARTEAQIATAQDGAPIDGKILRDGDKDQLLWQRLDEFGNGWGVHAINLTGAARNEELLRRQQLLRGMWIYAHRMGIESEGRADSVTRAALERTKTEIPELTRPITDGSFDVMIAGEAAHNTRTDPRLVAAFDRMAAVDGGKGAWSKIL
ncbi:MAG: hypothetical protein NUV91_07745, partial [Candidatus Omnitrophica bacterium]|nr:hypothetical protein [Candidatus Omnitrophota bacterium]